jgi:hypothetical protein
MALDSGEIDEVNALIDQKLAEVGDDLNYKAKALLFMGVHMKNFTNSDTNSIRVVAAGLSFLLENETFETVEMAAKAFDTLQEDLFSEEIELPESLQSISVENGFVTLTRSQVEELFELLTPIEEEE